MRWMGMILLLAGTSAGITRGDDWTRFRGPDGSGVSAEKNIPTEWSDSDNLAWKTRLPGPGSSSPIVVGDKVFVTCYSGYGVDRGNPGELSQLKRHLVCVNRTNGEIIWEKAIPARLPEDNYSGFLTEHGYATHTPVTDGQAIFAFFGKSGVFAFDLQGNQLWQVDVGQESGRMRWGSGASLILYQDSVIVNASEESESLRALDKKTGNELWKAEAAGLGSTWGTPLLITRKDGLPELVIGVPGEIWGLNPDNGKLRWWCEHDMSGNISPSCFSDGEAIYLFGGRGGGSIAVRLGGEDDVTDTHVLWKGSETSYVATPLLYEGHLYWVDDKGVAYCSDARTGELKKRVRLATDGGLRSRPFYASPIVVDGNLIVVSRNNGTFIFKATPELEQVSQNRFAGDSSQSNATPAVSNGQLFLRSDQYLYCVSASKE